MNKFVFFHSTNLIGDNSLFDKFIEQLQHIERSPFFVQQIIVPSTAIGLWLKKKITQKFGICANIDFVVLTGPVIENIYRDNFPEHEIVKPPLLVPTEIRHFPYTTFHIE